MKLSENPDQHPPCAKNKTCPKCGAAFICGNAEGTCWCNTFPALEKADPSLDCFCPVCLHKITSKND